MTTCDIFFAILWFTNVVTIVLLLISDTRNDQMQGYVDRMKREG